MMFNIGAIVPVQVSKMMNISQLKLAYNLYHWDKIDLGHRRPRSLEGPDVFLFLRGKDESRSYQLRLLWGRLWDHG